MEPTHTAPTAQGTDVAMFPRADQTPAWAELQRHHAARGRYLDLRQAFAEDDQRFERFSQSAPHLFADLSKNLIDADSEALLHTLAQQCGVLAQRDALFDGVRVNTTEGRAAWHTLLRQPLTSAGSPAPDLIASGTTRALAEVHATLAQLLDYAEAVRADAGLTDIVHIGIGGSDLGPQMVVQALELLVHRGKRFHFVSNVDGHELASVLGRLDARRSLFVVASKSFTTLETMLNARSARQWFLDHGGQDVGRHFVGVTSNVAAAREFGITTTFGFWDWVGGRYSLWSAIGLPIALAIGAQGFRELLAGAHAMDRHFREAPAATNLPLRLGLLDVWYRNFHGFASRCVAPYHSGLRRWAPYLQQLEMESNGKHVDRQGRAMPVATAPVVWGEPGTNGQHAFFQMLHQGSDVVPVEFVAVRTPSHGLAGHHESLLANALAQAKALMVGCPDPQDGHRDFPGNRPSSFLLLERLDPAGLGALIALQEHRVFVSGALWGINSFDQFGVELGKQLARDIEPRLASGDAVGLDPSTAGLLRRLRTD